MRGKNVRSSRGFTLIEVLVALAIAAMGLAAVLGVVTNASRNSVYLREKTLATWIGLNRVTELRLATTFPDVSRTDGDVDFANDKWRWRQTITETGVDGMRRIDIAVRRADSSGDAYLATVSGFIGRTQITTPAAAPNWAYTGQP
jgi:general secretion pathway protein I